MTPERFQKLKHVLGRRQPDLTVLAADVHKPHNISAVFRTCDAVGIHRIHAVSPGGEFRHHRMASAGSRHWVDLVLHDSLDAAVTRLHGQGWWLVAAHPTAAARDFRDLDYTRKTALVIGSELEGLERRALAAADEIVNVPIEGMVESLNVSVAAALVLYEAQRQRRLAGMYDTCRLDAEAFERTLFEWAYPAIATRLRRLGRPYPALGDDGAMLTHPFKRRAAR